MTAVCVLSPFEKGFGNLTEYAASKGVFETFGEAERRRIEKMSNSDARARSLGGLLALERILVELEMDKEGLFIARDKLGKPYFSEREEIRFNISHASALSVAVCTIGNGSSVGIDIEEISEKIDVRKISERFFGQREREYLLRSDYCIKNFFLVWTAKEALSKCVGDGLASSLSGKDTFEASESKRAFFARFEIAFSGKAYIMTVCSLKEESLKNIKIICDGDIGAYEISNRA